jgi:hypothetical protein
VARDARQVVTDLGQLVRESIDAGRRAMADKEAEVRASLEE